MLRRRIIYLVDDEAKHRSDVYHRTATGTNDLGDCVLTHEKYAFDVDRHHCVPGLFGAVHNATFAKCDSRAVDNSVESSEFLDCVGNGALYSFRIGDISFKCDRDLRRMSLVDLVGNCLGRLTFEISTPICAASAANRWHVAFPRPEPPPVMMKVLFSRTLSWSSPLLFLISGWFPVACPTQVHR